MRRALANAAALAAALGAGAASLGPGGCGGPRPAPAPAPEPARAAAPGVRGAESGLEMLWWVVRDDGSGIARAFAPYEHGPTPLAPRSQRLWRENGIRVLSVPAGEVEALGAALRPMGPVHRQWLGECPRWTDAARGPVSREPMALDLDNGPLVLDPGRLRLLLRCWVVPGLWTDQAVAPGLRVELAVQHLPLDAPRVPPPRGLSLPTVRAAEEEGVVFTRLTLEFIADPDHAIVLVPESPDAEWTPQAQPGTPEAPPPAPGPARFGPRPPDSPRLGEALLTLEDPLPVAVRGEGTPDSPSVRLSRRVSRAVVVLVPRLPPEFALPGLAAER